MPEEKVNTCPSCGYTEEDARFNGDHRLCNLAGKAPWDKPAADAGPRQPTVIDDTFVAAVEDRLGMGHGAWDMIGAEKICRAVLEQAAAPPVPQEAAPRNFIIPTKQISREELEELYPSATAPDWAMRVADELVADVVRQAALCGISVNLKRDDHWAALIREAGSERERELREALQTLRNLQYGFSESGQGFMRCHGCGISSLQQGPWDHLGQCAVAEAERLLGGGSNATTK